MEGAHMGFLGASNIEEPYEAFGIAKRHYVMPFKP